MTIKLNWKSGLVIASIVVAVIGFAYWHMRKDSKTFEKFVETETELRLEIEKLEEAVVEKEVEKESLREEADLSAKSLADTEAALAKARSFARRARKQAEDRGGLDLGVENSLLREEVKLLDTALVYSKVETAKWKQLASIAENQLAARTKQVRLFEKRIENYEDLRKKSRRNRIFSNIGIGVAGAATGFTVGFVASRATK